MDLQRFFFLLGLFMVSMCYCGEDKAFQQTNAIEATFQENAPLQVVFSKDFYNRVAWKDDRIVSVTGDERLFNVEINPKIGQAFISVLKPLKDKPAMLTIVSGRGFVQDIEIKSEGKPSTFLSIQVPQKDEELFAASYTHFHSQTIEFLNHILEGRVPFGYTQRYVQDSDGLTPPAPLEATPLKVFENPFETVVIYEIINQGRRPIILRSQDLKPSLNSWVFLSAQELHLREVALCIVATSK